MTSIGAASPPSKSHTKVPVEMEFSIACMESSAQDAALELLVAFSIGVLRLLALLGDTISSPCWSAEWSATAPLLPKTWIGTMQILTASRPGRETKCGLANLVAGEAV